MKLRKAIGLAIAITIVGVAGYVGYWFVERAARLSQADPAAIAALASTAAVRVSENDWYIFEPTAKPATTGFIFYPGGECDERGYAELLRAVAEQGFLVVLVPMPLQLAVLAPNKADDVMAAFPHIKTWAIGGHSLGGAMAARYVHTHPETIDGLLFWDAYPPETDDLSERQLKVRMIHRADDSGEIPDYYNQYIPLLPDDMDYRALPGAIHINFGRFIPAERFRIEVPPSMPIDRQHQLIVEYTTEFLRSL